jgi:hypothetical protein
MGSGIRATLIVRRSRLAAESNRSSTVFGLTGRLLNLDIGGRRVLKMIMFVDSLIKGL